LKKRTEVLNVELVYCDMNFSISDFFQTLFDFPFNFSENPS